MGIFGALTTSVAGLRAGSYALENISGNIANSQTTAFKRVDTAFIDLIPSTSVNQQLSGSVTTQSRSTNTVQGGLENASVATYMAINGQGFFVVQKPGSFADNNPVFTGVDMYTRRGDFMLDKNGYLVNGAGYYLEGILIDPATGNLSGSAPSVLKFENNLLPARSTTRIDYRANLPQYPLTTNADPAVPGSELLNPADFANDPTTGGTGVVTGVDAQTFVDNSIAGGALTVYDPVGSPVNLQLRWAKVDNSASGGADTWNLFYLTDSNATGSAAAWQNAGVDFTFGPNGQPNPPISSLTLTNATVNGVQLGDVSMFFGTGGMTQFADPNGNVQVNQIQQDGYPAGFLQSVSMGENGRIVGNYSNGRNIDLAQVVLANFNGPDFLKRVDGGAFEATDQSGQAIYRQGGNIIGSALEGSNVDIADEFTKLIITQQAYSANTKVITTTNSMVQDLINVIR
ncbi:MAG TPA: flagellar hook-basal body complex protein [Xanthobacteraceae bacterium]|nr:flagellar hook-basal body complex protein [Xanthobacteraceae bacterium]